MIYLTMLVSELPVVPVLTPDQKIYLRLETPVPREFNDLVSLFDKSIKHQQSMSTHSLASADETTGSG